MCVLQNVGTFIAPPIIGFIHDHTLEELYGYFWVEIFFTVVSVIALILTIMVYRFDKNSRENILQSVNVLKEFKSQTQTMIERTMVENSLLKTGYSNKE